MFWRGRVLLYSGQSETARKNLNFALSNDPDNKMYSNFWRNMKKMDKMKEGADLAQKENQPQVALQMYEECLGLDPLNSGYMCAIYNNRANALLKMG